MKRGIVLFLAIIHLVGTQAFANSEWSVEFFLKPDLAPKGQSLAELPEPVPLFPIMMLAQATASDAAIEIPRSVRNNRYFTESLKLSNQAKLSYDEGDYDASAQYAEEAVRFARLSDEYIALQLKIRETNNAITAAKRRLDQTLSSGASAYFPNEYAEAQRYYSTSLTQRSTEKYDDAIDAAKRVLLILADVRVPPPAPIVVEPKPELPPPPVVEAPPPPPPPVVEVPAPVLPAQYTVRPWNPWRDCLWNIAGRSWAYGDSTKWRIIYDANRSKFPQPDNPDLIHPGMVLDIPSINGEVRQGMWDEKTEYPPLP
ncbi:MAG: LysM peptidoglycan-binding domain-containing protein [Treponema sp.]|jgi:tetratricopeptide (TPR) repeat protein|nr:LysM peptidoglycan-binding domain-containing protein [Treponema sp.]